MIKLSEKQIFQLSALLLAGGAILTLGIAVGESHTWRTGYGKEIKTVFSTLATYGEVIPEGRRHMPPDGAVRKRTHVHAPEKTAGSGYYAISGYSEDFDGFAVWVLDSDGNLLNARNVDGNRLKNSGNAKSQGPHGMEMLPDGSVIITYDQLGFMARLDACGEPIWIQDGFYHHSLAPAEDGGIWTWYGEGSSVVEYQYMVKFDPETGKETKRIGLIEDVIRTSKENASYFAYWQDADFRTFEEGPHDVFHPNDLEELTSDKADAFPMFETGDLLISLRTLSMVAVLGQDGTVKWARFGPWLKQHDPDFHPDGTITIYNNAFRRDHSEILAIDPATGEISPYLNRQDFPFKSEFRGKHEHLPNGNMLLTIPEQGQIFELTRDGDVVLEINNVLAKDPQWNEDVANAKWYPDDFLTEIPTCAATE